MSDTRQVDFNQIINMLRVAFEIAATDSKVADDAEALGQEFLGVLAQHVEAKDNSGTDRNLAVDVLAIWYILGSFARSILENATMPDVTKKGVH